MSISSSEVVVSNEVLVDGSAHVQPVSGPLTDAQLRAAVVPVSVSGAVSVSNFPATQPVSGTVAVSNFPATQPVSGPLTDAQLRAAVVPVTVSNFPATQPVSGPLTDTQLRATPVPISGSVSTTPLISSSATVAQVVLAASTNAMALAANPNRKKVVLFAPKNTLYIKFGATASSTSFTYIVTAANTTLELTNWAGQIDVLSSVNQTINVTEMV